MICLSFFDPSDLIKTSSQIKIIFDFFILVISLVKNKFLFDNCFFKFGSNSTSSVMLSFFNFLIYLFYRQNKWLLDLILQRKQQKQGPDDLILE